MAQWTVNTPQGNRGPFDDDRMRALMASGHINAQSWIWRDGLESWTQLKDTELGEGAGAAAVETSAPAPAAEAASTAMVATTGALDQGHDERMDQVFVDLIKKSWERHAARERAGEVDEVLIGGVITGVLDNGFDLIDLTSDGDNHYLRFEDLRSGERVIFKLRHLANSLVMSRVIGHEAQVTIGYGERVRDFSKIWGALKQEMKGGYIRQVEPGILTIDGDISSQYIYVEVGMLWDISDYLDPDDPYRVRYPKLSEDLGASIHALRKYLRGRLTA